MKEPLAVADISADEQVSRFVTSRHWIRPSDNTVKPDAFTPARDLNLSVTRRLDLSEEALWEIGENVVTDIGQKRSAVLFGRADLSTQSITLPLKLEAAPLSNNQNHAHIIGWPADKPAQKNLAQCLAAMATYFPFKVEDPG